MRHRRLSFAVAAILLVTRAHGQASPTPDSAQATIQELYDLVGERPPYYTYMNPIRLDVFSRVTRLHVDGGASITTSLFWFGRPWGRLLLLPDMELTLLKSIPTGLSTVLGGSLARVDDQYICREKSTGDVTVMAPMVQDLTWLVGDPSHQGCQPRESTAYYAEALAVDWRPTLKHVALRAVDAGFSYNVNATGRTRDAFKTFLELRAGASVDYVHAGTTASIGNDAAVRAAFGVRAGTSNKLGSWRGTLDMSVRPRLFVDGDTLGEASGAITHVMPLSRAALLDVSVRSAVVYATRPWMIVSGWADPTEQWSALVGVELRLDWRTPAL